jgi:transposase
VARIVARLRARWPRVRIVLRAGAGPLIEGGLPTERMMAHVLVAKYADHGPLYHQAQMLAR